MELGDAAITVLGNHDLHFLAIHRGGHSLNRSDTLRDLMAWKKVDTASDWLRHRALLHRDETLGYLMAHAGIPHIWSPTKAEALAGEVEDVMQGPQCERYFREMYGNEPSLWRDDWEGMLRWRVITNYLTRMRLLDERGALDFSHKGSVESAPAGLTPWFDLQPGALEEKILFGHWAAIEGRTGREDIIALDTGCVWGRNLTALCLDDGVFYST
jgi:bis(5'-nucleosyl)-tetraphosphatase (symmetrical)